MQSSHEESKSLYRVWLDRHRRVLFVVIVTIVIAFHRSGRA
jgi:hypothetical protein